MHVPSFGQFRIQLIFEIIIIQHLLIKQNNVYAFKIQNNATVKRLDKPFFYKVDTN